MASITTVEMYQRTALGGTDGPRDSTKVYIFCPENGYPGLVADTDIKSLDYYDDYRGFVIVNHPEIMWGSWEENSAAMGRMAKQAIIDLGLVVPNDWGVYHWRSN